MAHVFVDPIPELQATLELAKSPLYKIVDKNLDINTRAQIVYDRARAVSRTIGAYFLTGFHDRILSGLS